MTYETLLTLVLELMHPELRKYFQLFDKSYQEILELTFCLLKLSLKYYTKKVKNKEFPISELCLRIVSSKKNFVSEKNYVR